MAQQPQLDEWCGVAAVQLLDAPYRQQTTPQASRAMTRGEPQPQPDPSARPIMTATSATANSTEPVQSNFLALLACAADGITAATASKANAQTIVPNQYAPLRPQD